jgi:hypothetical protein
VGNEIRIKEARAIEYDHVVETYTPASIRELWSEETAETSLVLALLEKWEQAESQRDSALARLAFVEGQRNLLHTEMESIRFLANKALGDSMFAVPPAMTAPDVARCTVCRWPLAESMEQGCVPGNCSYRPRTKGTPDHG